MADSSEDKKRLLFMARLAEDAERWEDMAGHMKARVLMGDGLSRTERDALAVAYKNVVGTRRSAWRYTQATEEGSSDGSPEKSWAAEYRGKIESELKDHIGEILSLLSDHLVPTAESKGTGGEKVFYAKMQGDYERYKAEFMTDQARDAAVKAAAIAYANATTKAKEELPPSDVVRLGLALNSSVFRYEIVGEKKEAIAASEEAHAAALGEFDKLSDNGKREAQTIMNLMQDNVAMWKSESS